MKILAALLFMPVASMAMHDNNQNMAERNPFENLPKELIWQEIFKNGLDLNKLKRVSSGFERFVKGTSRKAYMTKIPDFSDLQFLNYDGSNVIELKFTYSVKIAVTDDTLEIISEKFTDLKGLDLSFSKKITDEGLKSLSKLSHLTSLDLSWNEQITDAGIGVVGESSTKLKSLYLNSLPITNKSLQSISKLTNLTTLSLHKCTNITSEAFTYLINLPLTALRISSFGDRLQDEDLKTVGQLGNLKSLNLSYSYITEEGLLHLKGLKNLKFITLGGCPIEEKVIYKILKDSPNLRYSEFNPS